MRKIACFLISVLFLFSCTTYKLEKRLTPEVNAWYSWHKYIMNAPVPEWIQLPKKFKTERDIFLRLSPEAQKKYIEEIFWQVREGWLKQDYDERIALVKNFLKWNPGETLESTRVRLLLWCGWPDFVYNITASEIIEEYGQLLPTEMMDIEGNVYLVWEYINWADGARPVRFYFGWDGFCWRLVSGFDTSAVKLIEYRTSYFWPFEDNWLKIEEFAQKELRLPPY